MGQFSPKLRKNKKKNDIPIRYIYQNYMKIF